VSRRLGGSFGPYSARANWPGAPDAAGRRSRPFPRPPRPSRRSQEVCAPHTTRATYAPARTARFMRRDAPPVAGIGSHRALCHPVPCAHPGRPAVAPCGRLATPTTRRFTFIARPDSPRSRRPFASPRSRPTAGVVERRPQPPIQDALRE